MEIMKSGEDGFYAVTNIKIYFLERKKKFCFKWGVELCIKFESDNSGKVVIRELFNLFV